MDAFQHSFNLDKNSPHFANLQGNIVSVLQVRKPPGCARRLDAELYTGRMLFRSLVVLLR